MVYCVSTSTYYDVSILCHDVIIYSNNYIYIVVIIIVIYIYSSKYYICHISQKIIQKKHHPVDLNAVIDPQTPLRLGSRERNPMELIMSAMGVSIVMGVPP